MFEHSTLRLNSGDVTLLQALGETAQDCACLVQYNGADAGKRHALPEGRIDIGRALDARVCIETPGISRRHVELEVTAEAVTLRDLGSANGTHLNGVRVERPVRLQEGDLIRLGDTVLKFFQRASLDALLHDRIYRMATLDAGTEVFCKRYLVEALEREVRLSHRWARPLSLVCLDLDHFKSVNDRFGHGAGDAVLRATAAAMQATVRGCDVLGRVGGEEFAVVLPQTVLADAIVLAERIRGAVQRIAFELRDHDGGGGRAVRHVQTASLGVAQLAAHMPDAHSLLEAADALLYRAKRTGRNRVAA